MKRYFALIALLFLLTSCQLFESGDAPADNGDEQQHVEEIQEITMPERKEFGTILPSQIDTYIDFQTRVACGEEHEDLLYEYNWTMGNVAYYATRVSNETLKERVFEQMRQRCPNRIEQVELSIGKVEE